MKEKIRLAKELAKTTRRNIRMTKKIVQMKRKIRKLGYSEFDELFESLADEISNVLKAYPRRKYSEPHIHNFMEELKKHNQVLNIYVQDYVYVLKMRIAA